MKNRINNEKIMYVCAVVGYFLLLLIWSLNQDFGSGPEEKMRYQIPQFIIDNNRLPTLFDSSIYDSYYGFSYAGQPCLPYLFGALFMKIARVIGIGEANLYMAARLTSILCGCVFLILTIKISKEIFNQKSFRVAFVTIIVLWKYTCYLFTYVNCDSMCLVGIAVIILYCIRGLKEEWTIGNCIGLAVGNSIVLLSYINGLSYSIVSVFVFIASYITMKDEKKRKYLEMLKKGIGITLIALLMSAWFYIRNIILYGSLFGSNIANSTAKIYGSHEVAASVRSEYARKTMFTFKGLLEWIKGQIISFGGQFTVEDTFMSTLISYTLMLISVLLIVVSVYKIIKNRRNMLPYQKIMVEAMALGGFVTIAVDFYYSAFVTYIAYYARYLLPMIISFGFFMLYGYFIEKDRNKSKIVRSMVSIVIILLVISDLVAASRGI